MPKAKPAADSGALKTNSKKTLEVITQRASRKNPLPPSRDPTLAASESPPSYPWDSHQDDIVVNSVEVSTRQRTGVQHYLHQLSLRKDYTQICTDFNEYRCRGSTKLDLSDIDDEEQHGIEEKQRADDIRINYSKAPNPPPSVVAYEYQIYKCTTTNPAVFLAITRIAQRNLPFINFRSALNHLPNLLPTKPLPELRAGGLAEDIAHEERRESDHLVTVLFFPHFYHDGRDAVGYYVPSMPRIISISDHRQRGTRDAKQMLFTPCTQNELDKYGLVTYIDHDRTQEGIETNDESGSQPWVKSVGVKGGRWIDADVLEESAEVREAFGIVADVWQKRLEATTLKDWL